MDPAHSTVRHFNMELVAPKFLNAVLMEVLWLAEEHVFYQFILNLVKALIANLV